MTVERLDFGVDGSGAAGDCFQHCVGAKGVEVCTGVRERKLVGDIA